MACDLCGAEGQMFKVLIEGTEMTVCKNCSTFGKVKSRVKTKIELKREQKSQQKYEQMYNVPKKETLFLIVDNYSSLIKSAREKLGLKQEIVAKKIAEKESLLHNIESGHFEPSIKTARKLERFFNIKLVEQHTEEISIKTKKSNQGMTLGDMIKIKKR